MSSTVSLPKGNGSSRRRDSFHDESAMLSLQFQNQQQNQQQQPSSESPAPNATMNNNNDNNNNLTSESDTETSNAATTPTTTTPTSTTIKVSSIFYIFESFWATAVPVTITMILAAICTNYIRTEESAAARSQQLTASYSTIAVDDDASSSQQISYNLINGLVIVAVITCMTFLIVLLYKYKCLWCLKGYILLSITFLLGYFGGTLWYEAIQRYELTITKITFSLALYNFTVVGIYAIFYQHGVPTYVTQGYLICMSVILAWELSHFSDILGWILLILLALYDLYAVLTPWGPLKCLVNLMGQDGAQQIPGLLYEAQLPNEARRPQASTRGNASSNQPSSQPPQSSHASTSQQPRQNTATLRRSRGSETRSLLNHIDATSNYDGSNPNQNDDTDNGQQSPSIGNSNNHASPETSADDEEKKQEEQQHSDGTNTLQPPRLEELTPLPPPTSEDQQDDGDDYHHDQSMEITLSPNHHNESQLQQVVVSPTTSETTELPTTQQQQSVDRPSGTVPLAIAKLYQLELADPSLARQEDLTVDQLRADVQVYYPRNGGRMEQVETATPSNETSETNETNNTRGRRWPYWRRSNADEETPTTSSNQPTKYNVIDRHGEIKRTIFVGEDGKVYRFVERNADGEEEDVEPSSVKLGLGDFIFYSLLVSKASQYSFAAFWACAVAILVGLLLTLMILALRGKALPALPISIFFGVLFYFPTRYVLEPYIHNMFWAEMYV